MNKKLARFEKYSVAPSPSRDYYGLKVLNDQVILYLWKITHGPHLSPIVKVTKFSEFVKDRSLRDEISYAFGPQVLNSLDVLTSKENISLLNLPKGVIEKLVKYLSLKDIAKLYRLSHKSNEIFNSNSIWEILYKRLKGSSTLTEMEKDLGSSQGFKKLAKSHQLRQTTKKNIKFGNDKPTRSQKSTGRNEKVLRSASVNLTPGTLQNETKKVLRKPVKVVHKIEGKKLNIPEIITTNEKPLIFIGNQNLDAKCGAGESYQHPLIINEGHLKNKIKEKSKEIKPDEKIKKEEPLELQKKFLKNLILESEMRNDNSSEAIKKRALTMKSPRSIFTKHSTPTLGELKSKATDKNTVEKKKLKATKDKVSSNARLDLKNLASDDKNDDSDGSGMSYLMKRYLAASEEIEKKFANCERLAHSTKDSSIQVDINKKPERKLTKRVQKLAVGMDRPASRSVRSTSDVFTKLKSLKKN